MSNNAIFLFQSKVHKDTKSSDYNLYLFKDFTGDEQNIQEEVFDVLDEVRQRIHSPKTIYILCSNQDRLDKDKIGSRFNDQSIAYIDYKNITSEVFKYGVAEIVKKNKVVQHAPHGTRFKKTSGAESDYFIKASLSLLEYSEICFLALATCHKITTKKLLPFKNIYVDTSSIISLVQAVVYCYNTFLDCQINPQIINFKSYKPNNIDFNRSESFTIISASSSGNLRKDNHIDSNKCLTLFYPKIAVHKEECLFELEDIKDKPKYDSPRLIPLTSEDFSLEYSKSKEVIIKKVEVKNLDSKQTIKKILGDEFKNISYTFKYDELKKSDCITFEPEYIYKLLENNKFIGDTFTRSLSLEKENLIIYDFENPLQHLTKIKAVKKSDFLQSGDINKSIDNKNIVVFLTQATGNELINISQKLRKYIIINITYIIGVLITDNCSQSKNLENNICFNDTNYKYSFYCYLSLPLSAVQSADIDSYKLTNGFVFYDKKGDKDLHPKQVYLVVCLILELLRSNGKLSDNISHHDVLSPKNFSRFNDSLLQLSLLNASRGRELNFHSNIELSREMKDVVMDLMVEKSDIGTVFIDAVKDGKIKLTDEDVLIVETEYPHLFEEQSEI